ncbi:sulfite exporter TauE/SafE family protein [bacterium]|nr:sulfite exporter TauE/SafE family protein [bacterium]
MPISILTLLGIGLAAGILSGLVGIGGGLVIVPLLVMLGGMTQISAQGTSIGALILPVGIFAAMKYYRAGNLDIRSSLYIAFAMALGAYLGATLALQLPQDTLKKIFGIVLVSAGLKFLIGK